MKATQSKLLNILGSNNVQFIVPIFQRVYSWTKDQCSFMFDDILHAGEIGRDHFMGAFLYSTEGVSDDGYTQCQIVDGQQRMTTLTLIMVAFIDWVRAHDARIDCLDHAALAKHFLFAGGKGDALKLLLTSTDRDMLEYIMGAAEKPDDDSSQLEDNIKFFKSKMASEDFDPDEFWKGLNALSVVEISLEKNDSPQRIFESINSKGKRLNMEDILRNAILMETHPDDSSYSYFANASGKGAEANECEINADENIDAGSGSEAEARAQVSHSDALKTYIDLWEPIEDAYEEVEDVTIDDMICCWLNSLYNSTRVKSEDDLYTMLHSILKNSCGGSYAKLIQKLQAYSNNFLADENVSKEAMKRMEKWRSGIPTKSISQYKLFGD